MLFDYGVDMNHPLLETLRKLKDPNITEVAAIGIERQLTIKLINKLKENISEKCNCDAKQMCNWIIELIENENHWDNFREFPPDLKT